MSAPVPEQAILGPLIYAPPWARRQPPPDADREDRTEPAAAEPLGLRDLGIRDLGIRDLGIRDLDMRDKDTSFAPQPQDGFEDDLVEMTLEECLALAPDQGTDAPEPVADAPQRCGIAWPVVTRLACTILLALAGALGFRWLSVAPEPREGLLVVHEPLAPLPAAPITVTTLKADRESQSVPPWSLDLMLAAGTGHDPARQLTMSAAAAPAPAGGTTAAAIISTGPAQRAARAPASQGNGPRATMVRAWGDESR
jgi:hypothetical protein